MRLPLPICSRSPRNLQRLRWDKCGSLGRAMLEGPEMRTLEPFVRLAASVKEQAQQGSVSCGRTPLEHLVKSRSRIYSAYYHLFVEENGHWGHVSPPS